MQGQALLAARVGQCDGDGDAELAEAGALVRRAAVRLAQERLPSPLELNAIARDLRRAEALVAAARTSV